LITNDFDPSLITRDHLPRWLGGADVQLTTSRITIDCVSAGLAFLILMKIPRDASSPSNIGHECAHVSTWLYVHTPPFRLTGGWQRELTLRYGPSNDCLRDVHKQCQSLWFIGRLLVLSLTNRPTYICVVLRAPTHLPYSSTQDHSHHIHKHVKRIGLQYATDIMHAVDLV
jgi:hypothetical protein